MEDPPSDLTPSEVIDFLASKGGRSTNRELVSHFRSILNNPFNQDAMRLKFKDIVNTIASVQEENGMKYIVLRPQYASAINFEREVLGDEVDYYEENPECSGSPSKYQPYWRYRLSSNAVQVPTLVSPSRELTQFSPRANDASSFINNNHQHHHTNVHRANSQIELPHSKGNGSFYASSITNPALRRNSQTAQTDNLSTHSSINLSSNIQPSDNLQCLTRRFSEGTLCQPESIKVEYKSHKDVLYNEHCPSQTRDADQMPPSKNCVNNKNSDNRVHKLLEAEKSSGKGPISEIRKESTSAYNLTVWPYDGHTPILWKNLNSSFKSSEQEDNKENSTCETSFSEIKQNSGPCVNSIIEEKRENGHVNFRESNEGYQSTSEDCSLEQKQQTNIPEPSERLNSSMADSYTNNDGTGLVVGSVREQAQRIDHMVMDKSHLRTTSVAHNEPRHIKGSRLMLDKASDDNSSILSLDTKLRKQWFLKAAQCDYHSLVSLLKAEPRLASVKDITSGFTALHWAAKHGNAEVVKLIAGSYNVSPDMKSHGGYTCIHIASIYRHKDIVELLLTTYGADPWIRDNSGKRADQYPTDYLTRKAGVTKILPVTTIIDRPKITLNGKRIHGLPEKESSSSSFIRIGSLNLKVSRSSGVFASVRGRRVGNVQRLKTWGSADSVTATRFKESGNRSSHFRKKKQKKSSDVKENTASSHPSKGDSDSDSAYGFRP